MAGIDASGGNSAFRPREDSDDNRAQNRARPRGHLHSRWHGRADHPCVTGRGGGVRLQIRYRVARRAPDGHSLARSNGKDQGGKWRAPRHYVLPEQRARPGHRDDVAGDSWRARNLRHVIRHPGAESPSCGDLRGRLRFPNYDVAWKAMDGDLGTIAAACPRRPASTAWTRRSITDSAKSR